MAVLPGTRVNSPGRSRTGVQITATTMLVAAKIRAISQRVFLNTIDSAILVMSILWHP